MACGNPAPTMRNFTPYSNGIIPGHAYAILDMREFPTDGLRLMQLRNPWGDTEWNGDWSDESDKWNQKYRSLLDHKSEVDGIFWMSFDDFIHEFSTIYLCRTFENVVDVDEKGMPLPSVKEKSNDSYLIPVTRSSARMSTPVSAVPRPVRETWYRAKVVGEWKGETAAGCTKWVDDNGRPWNNPHYSLTLRLSRRALAFLTLTQPTKTNKNRYVSMALLVLDKAGKRVRTIKKREIVAGNAKCRPIREFPVEATLQPGVAYTLFPTTFERGVESPFTITVYCREPICLNRMGTDVPYT